MIDYHQRETVENEFNEYLNILEKKKNNIKITIQKKEN